MLTITNDQINTLGQTRYSSNLAKVEEALRLEYKQQAIDDQAFESWFAHIQAECKAYQLGQTGSLLVYGRYALEAYPHFPKGDAYQTCHSILSDLELEEGDKLDKVNYRLMFIR